MKKWIELLVIYVILPGLLYFYPIWPIAILPVAGFLVFLLVRHERGVFNRKVPLGKILWQFILLAVCLTLFAYFFARDNFFIIFSYSRMLPLLLAITYPLFAVIPQTLIYRTLFFQRYAKLFPDNLLILVNAVLFSFGHVIYQNAVALLLTFFAGLIFAYNYKNDRSFWGSVLLHSLLGIYLFYVGIGIYLVTFIQRY